MPTQDPSTKHVLEGRELIDYLIEKTSGATNAQMLQREERRNRRTAAYLSILAFVGIGAIISAMKMFVQQEMATAQVATTEMVRDSLTKEFNARLDVVRQTIHEEAVEQVSSQIGEIQLQLQHDSAYRELLFLADKIQKAVDAANNSADLAGLLDKAVAKLMELSKAESIRSESRFLEAMNVVVSLLVRGDLDREINRLDRALGDVMATHRQMTLDLTDHYGQVIIKSPHPVAKLQHEADALARYARASRDVKYPEKAMMWELFVAYKESGFQATYSTRAMVDQIRDLSDVDSGNFCKFILMYQDPRHWMRVPDHEGREMGRLVNGLLEQHPSLQEFVQEQVTQNAKLRAMVRQLASIRSSHEGSANRTPLVSPMTLPTLEPPPASTPPTEATAEPLVAAPAHPTPETPTPETPTLADPAEATASEAGNALRR